MKLFQAYMHLLIFLSLAATSPAVAKYAKTGCNDSCGNNVTIPFPFGIGSDCAVNEWYIVECNNSTPYLPAVLNRPEVLGVNLEDQTITVSTPKITGCQNTVGNIDQSDHEHESWDASFIPISLLWTLTDSDQFTCCDGDNPTTRVVGMFNDTQVDTLKCVLPRLSLSEDNPYLKDGCIDYVPTPKYAKPGCNDTCGNNVTIPFPFGIGANCAVNQWYIVDCNNARPYISAINHLEVLGVDLEKRTVTVATSRITDCQNPVQNSSEIMGVDIGGSPFLFSEYNRFVFKGCGNAVMLMDNGSVVTGCSTACVTHELNNDRDKCFGMDDCCETVVPYYFKSYNINLIGLEEEDGGCGSAFLVDETSYLQGTWFPVSRNTSFFNVPISFRWTLAESDQFTCCENLSPQSGKVNMLNGTTLNTLECSAFSSFEGNLYIVDGCNYGYGM
ncbi:hypothetical protein R6Q59_007804 [Mikania micrantha]